MSPKRRGGVSVKTSNEAPMQPMGRGASRDSSSRMTIDDLFALVKSMEARMNAQDEEIQVLKKDNVELWQEIHRLEGPRFPFEIFSAIILSIAQEKKALTTFSLVSRGWMSVTRRVLFKEIQYSAADWSGKIDVVSILNNDYCTVFSSVQHIDLTGTAYGTDSPEWMVGFLPLIHKFVTLRSLMLTCVTTFELEEIRDWIPQFIRNNIKELSIQSSPHRVSDLAAVVSEFNALETLSSSRYSEDEIPESIHGLPHPPPSIGRLVFRGWDTRNRIAPAILQWFIELHPGIIDSIDPDDLAFEKQVEFSAFLSRFGSNITKIRFSFWKDEDEILFLRSGYCAALPKLKSIELDSWSNTFAYSFGHKSFLRKIEWLPKILALLPPSIEEIILSVQVFFQYSEDGFGSIDWPQLDRSLTGSQYPLLSKLKIQMPVFMAAEVNQHLKEVWPKLLPICAEKGMLDIDI
ncbi:hypothetical protein C8R43DRAFT_969048, partial [Mycena crocata]